MLLKAGEYALFSVLIVVTGILWFFGPVCSSTYSLECLMVRIAVILNLSLAVYLTVKILYAILKGDGYLATYEGADGQTKWFYMTKEEFERMGVVTGSPIKVAFTSRIDINNIPEAIKKGQVIRMPIPEEEHTVEENDSREDLCMVCMIRTIKVATMPCGHKNMCLQCAREVTMKCKMEKIVCIVCRRPVQSYERIIKD